jgi:pyruvate,water dikinase
VTDRLAAKAGTTERWDPLNSPTGPELHWSTANLGEAMPGVQTPLSWSLWADPSEHSAREGAFAIGALTHRERAVPPTMDGRFFRVFAGRAAVGVEYLGLIGDRMPGTTGPRAAASVIGTVPADLRSHPTRRRYPAVGWRLPRTFATAPRQARRHAAEVDRWYHEHIDTVADLDLGVARALFLDARDKLDASLVLQAKTMFAVAQPLYTALTALIEQAGVGDTATLSGAGGAERAVISDLWAAAHGRLDLAEVVRRHGFHGPAEGELSSRVWREDDSPLRRMLAFYADRDDPAAEDPQGRRVVMHRRVLAALPFWQRPGARLLMDLAKSRILIRGVAKRAFVQSFDMARAAARRIGTLHAEAGLLNAADDVFYLVVDELATDPTEATRKLVDKRRARHAEYLAVGIPELWKGTPTPSPPLPAVNGQPQVSELRGTGVSGGVVEGLVRVVTDPSFDDVETDEILVAPTTDPSWSSIMYVSSALVVDIGGPLSHAAVVARELGVPCVVSTGNGSRILRTGDRVRVDGTTGTVTLLQRAAHPVARPHGPGSRTPSR